MRDEDKARLMALQGLVVALIETSGASLDAIERAASRQIEAMTAGGAERELTLDAGLVMAAVLRGCRERRR